MRTINYESDFKIREQRNDGTPMWNAPFRFTYYVKMSRGTFVASYDGREFINCHKGTGEDEGKLIVAFDSPQFGTGVLRVKREFFLTDSDFMDGVRHYVSDESTDVVLDRGATAEGVVVDTVFNPSYYKGDKGDQGDSAYQVWLNAGNEGSIEDFFSFIKGEKGDTGVGIEKVEQTTASDEDSGLNIIFITMTNGEQYQFKVRNGSKGDKGDTFTYDDLTQEQKENLAYQVIGEAENERRAAELVRQENEVKREAQEDARTETFNANERSREQVFNAAQNNRNTEFQKAETNRSNTFSANEVSRQQSFKANEQERKSIFSANEAERQASESARVTAEGARESAEARRKQAEEARESTFATNEKSRQDTFAANESARQATFDANEAIRQANETSRQDAEVIREENEKRREETYQQKVDRDDNAPKLTAGFANNLVGRGEATKEEISFRPSGGDTSIEDGTARIERVKGSTLVWNQRAFNNKDISFDVTFSDGYSMVSSGNLGVDGVKAGHKYLVSVDVIYTSEFTVGNFYFAEEQSMGTFKIGVPVITSPKSSYDAPLTLRFYITKDEAVGNSVSGLASMKFIDLTQMFGEGNEPTTIEEFHARKPLNIDEYAYNEGELISTNVDEIKSVGFNALNIDDRNEFVKDKTYGTDTPRELSENDYWLGIASNGISYKTSTDVTSVSIIDDVIRATSINQSYGLGLPMRVLSGTKFRFSCENSENLLVKIGYYDEKGIPLGDYVNSDLEFTTPSQCEWIMVLLFSRTVGTPFYVKCPCIHLAHTGYRNGEYEPYKEFRRSIPVKDIKDKDGNQLFPNGMLSAGSVYDEITSTKAIKRIGIVDMGSLNWGSDSNRFTAKIIGMERINKWNGAECVCSIPVIWGSVNANSQDMSAGTYLGILYIMDRTYTDTNTFKAAMSGVMLYYELAEPIEVDLPEPLNLDYEVSDFGTEEVLSSEPTTPMKADIIYHFNAVDRIRDNSRHTAEAETLLNDKADKSTVEAIQKKELQLSVKDNGNIILSNANGESKEFMPATPSGDPMHYQYIAAGFEYNGTGQDITKTGMYGDTIIHKAGLWYLNEVGDLTLDEVGTIYRRAKFDIGSTDIPSRFASDNSRTFLCYGDMTGGIRDTRYMFYYTNKAAKIRIAQTSNSALISNVTGMFYGSTVKDILTIMSFRGIPNTSSMFTNCANLENVNIQYLNKSIELKSASNITKRSVLYMINNISNSGTYAPTTAITITLHADAYARLANDTEVIAALETKNAALEGTGGSINLVSA